MDSNMIVAFAAVLFAVVSPIATAIINNKYQIKRHQMEFYQEYRAQVIEKYIHLVGSISVGTEYTQLKEYRAAATEIYLYVDKALWPTIKSIDEQIMIFDKAGIDHSSVRDAALKRVGELIVDLVQSLQERPRLK